MNPALMRFLIARPAETETGNPPTCHAPKTNQVQDVSLGMDGLSSTFSLSALQWRVG